MNEKNKKILFLSAAGGGILVIGLLIGHFTYRSFDRYDSDFRFGRMGRGIPGGQGFMDGRSNFGMMPGRGGRGIGGGMFLQGHMLDYAADRLDLTSEQEKKIEAIIDDLHDRQYDMVKLHRDSMDDALALFDKKTVTKEDVKALFDKNSGERDEFTAYASEKVADILNILNDDQKKEAKKLFSRGGFGPGMFRIR